MFKKSWKFKLLLIFILIFVGFLVCFYFWFTNTLALRYQAQEVASKAENYQVLEDYINQEYNRCQEFIAQKEGDFGSFEYCKNFIEWINEAPLVN